MRNVSLVATVLVAVIVGVVVVGIVRLGADTDRNWAIATDVSDLQGSVHRLSSLEWRAVAEGEVTAESAREVKETLETSRVRLAELRRRSGSPTLDRFATAFGVYAAGIREEFALLERGRIEDAEHVDETVVDPAFERVSAASAAAARAHRDRVRAASERSRSGSVLIAAFGLGLIVLLVRRFERITRSLAAAREGERARREREEWLSGLLGNAADAVAVTDAAGRVLWASDAIERLVGVPAERIAGTPLADHLTYRDEAREALIEILGRHGARGAIDTVAHTADGRAIDVEARVTNLLEDPRVRGMVINLRDVSERTALERDLRHQALHDPLTGLANRTLFEDRLTRAVATSRRSGGTLGVLFCDLDDFKTINDSLGHDTGDALLMELGRRFDAVLRSGDSVARLGGDEFAVLIEEACEPGTAVAVAERLLDAIRRPVVVGGRELAVHASVGLAIGDGRTDAQALLREADVAMYAAKADGKSRWRLFEPGMHDAVVRRLELRADLGFALERGELTLAYQPIVAVDSERIAGVEALLRWQHPERGTVSPAEFIPEAEETGLIVPIGRWVLEEATCRLAAWKREQPDRAPGYVSVNVAGPQLSDPAFTGHVAAALERSGLHPGELVLEVTESSMIDDGAAEMRLSELHDLGVRLAIDDFGSGYSALNYLRRFPLDILKIDRQFVQGLTTVPQDAALTGAMIAMAYALGLDVIAEGVEEAGQLDELRSLQCGLAQGYLFSRPVGPDELMAALAYAG